MATEVQTIDISASEIMGSSLLSTLTMLMVWVKQNPKRLVMDLCYDVDDGGGYHIYVYHRDRNHHGPN